MQVTVDNTKGADARFVADLRVALVAAGFEVEVREPEGHTLYDTAVHFVVEGVSVRVPVELGVEDLERVCAAVRRAEAQRQGLRQRARAVPVYQGETEHVLAWVDLFE